jgi:hypothetical protein
MPNFPGIVGPNVPVMPNPPVLDPMAPQVPPPQVQPPPQIQPPQVQPVDNQPVHDPVVQNVVLNGADGPNFENGAGQALHLAQAHDLGSGRDWDISSAKGAAELAAQSAKRIREMVSGSADFRQYEANVADFVAGVLDAHPEAEAAIAPAYTKLLQKLSALRDLRATFASGIKDGSNHADDPRAALDSIRKHLRVFRYETQRVLSQAGLAAGAQEKNELAMRAIQNFFTFGAKHHVSLDEFRAIEDAEREFFAAVGELEAAVERIDPNSVGPAQPPNFALRDVLPAVLDLSHRTNDRIRAFQDADASTAALRGILGEIPAKGGSRRVDFTAGIGLLIGLGFPGTFAAGAKVGARFKVSADISVPDGGGPLTVTFRIGGGAEAKALLRGLPLTKTASVKADAGLSGTAEHFTTRTYATVDDLILDARRNKLAFGRTLLGYVARPFVEFGSAIGRLGKTLFRWMGRRSDETKLTNASYLELLKHRGVVGALDGFLAQRANPMVVSERTGVLLTGNIAAQASGSILGFATAGASGSLARSLEVRVRGKMFIPAARTIRQSDNPRALLRPGPGGGEPAILPQVHSYDELLASYEDLLAAFRAAPPKDTPAWATFANAVRTHLVAAEALHRDGHLTREQADRLLARFSDPGVRIPPDIYREYLMDGVAGAKPPKIRTSAQGEIKVNVLSKQTDSFFGGLVPNPIAGAAVAGVAQIARRNIGLDNLLRYSWTSEKPAKPGADPRPWENTVKTTRRLSFMSNAPVRAILDHVVRAKIEARTGTLPGTDVEKEIRDAMLKEAALTLLPKLAIAGAKKAVLDWLSDPENVKKLVLFVLDHIDIPLDILAPFIEHLIENPWEALEDAFTAFIYLRGTDIAWQTEKVQTLEWSYEDGNLVGYALYDETSTKTGISVDPVGVGLGGSGDISYTVGESVKKQGMMVNPTLTTLMGKAEQFLFADTSATAPGNSEAFKNWLCKHRAAIEDAMRPIRDNAPEALAIKARAIEATDGDPTAVREIETAWNAVRDLPDNALPETRLEAHRRLLTTLVTAFRAPLVRAAAA